MTEILELDYPGVPGPNTSIFFERSEQIIDMYQRAFAGHPWLEDLSTDEIRNRLDYHAAQAGFTAFVEQDEAGDVLGALWYDAPTLEQLDYERGSDLRHLAEAAQIEHGLPSLFWEREVLVHPSAQGRGLGTRLRKDMLAYLESTHPNGALLLTRMRDDNHGIIRIATRLGYNRTGIRVQSTQNPAVSHEFWQRIIKSRYV